MKADSRRGGIQVKSVEIKNLGTLESSNPFASCLLPRACFLNHPSGKGAFMDGLVDFSRLQTIADDI